jgi:hypothetical protein
MPNLHVTDRQVMLYMPSRPGEFHPEPVRKPNRATVRASRPCDKMTILGHEPVMRPLLTTRYGGCGQEGASHELRISSRPATIFFDAVERGLLSKNLLICSQPHHS